MDLIIRNARLSTRPADAPVDIGDRARPDRRDRAGLAGRGPASSTPAGGSPAPG